jgi:antitoxin FitA
MATTVTVRNVPDDVRDKLAARAARSGRSLQAYLRARLIELAERPDPTEVLDRIAERKRVTGTVLTVAEILEHRDADRR